MMYRSGAALVAVVVLLGVTPPARAQAARRVRIVSTSGIPHHDVGTYTRSSFWKKGRPRGMPDHPTWRAAIDTVLGQLARERADVYLHTGDMVSGRWGVDYDRPKARIFGPTGTLGQRRAALRRAANLYYGQNLSWWASNGIPASRVHFGMGDHEYGDLEIHGVPRDHQYALVPEYRAAWRDHFVSGRGYRRLTRGQQRHAAYATMLPGQVGLVTLDPMLRQDGRILPLIGGAQEAWLARTLRALRNDGARYLIVQVEVPPLGPNRSNHSSDMVLRNGQRIYDICARAGVDLILSAEFHAITTTTTRRRKPVQIVHGGQLYRAHVTYLVIDVFGDHLEITAKGMTGSRGRPSAFWAPHRHRAPGALTMRPATTVLGRATLRDGRLINRSGYLTEGVG